MDAERASAGSRDRFSASGFDSVDSAADAGRYIAYLDAQAATPFWRERKRATLTGLGLPRGSAAGVDASRVLIEEARRRGGEGVSFEPARAEELPFGAGSFDTPPCARCGECCAVRRAAVRAPARARRRGQLPRRRDVPPGQRSAMNAAMCSPISSPRSSWRK